MLITFESLHEGFKNFIESANVNQRDGVLYTVEDNFATKMQHTDDPGASFNYESIVYHLVGKEDYYANYKEVKSYVKFVKVAGPLTVPKFDYNKDYFAFNDKLYNIHTQTVIDKDDPEVTGIIARNKFDMNYPGDDTSTPVFDTLINHEFSGNENDIRWFKILIGRL